MAIKYYNVSVDWNGETYEMVYPARSEESAWKKALEDINDSWVVSEESFRGIAKVKLRLDPPDTRYDYVSHYYGVNPVIGNEFRYTAMGDSYGATVVAPIHNDVASVFYIKDGEDLVMRMHPKSYQEATRSQGVLS